jgi:hypothetical protein
MDTKGTKELIEVLNPESVIRTEIQRQKRAIAATQLMLQNTGKSIIRRGINSLSRRGGHRSKLKAKTKKAPVATKAIISV